MSRRKNPVHSAYYIGLLSKFFDLAIEGNPYSKPTDKALLSWFKKEISNSDNTGATPEGAKKSYSKMRNCPWGCRFDVATLNELCKILAPSLPNTTFRDYQGFVKWAGNIPQGDDNELVKKAHFKVEEFYQQIEKQKNYPKNILGHALSLTFNILKIEEYFSLGEIPANDSAQQSALQKESIRELFELINTYPDQLVTESFLKVFNTVFVYDYSNVLSLRLTKKLWNGATQMAQYLKSIEQPSNEILRAMMELVANVMKAAWAAGEVEIARSFNTELAHLIEQNKKRNTLEPTQFFPYQEAFYSYKCCFEPSTIDEYNRFSQEIICPVVEQKMYVFKALKCTTCVALRQKNYQEAAKVLTQIRQECSIVFEENRLSKSLLAFYHYLQGYTFYYQGSNYYTEAEQQLTIALNEWEKLKLSAIVEAGYAYSLLGEIQMQKGDTKKAEKFKQQAAKVFLNAIKTHACSVNQEQIKEYLEGRH